MIITNQELQGEDIGDKTTRKALVSGDKMILV